ncbi:MAG: CotH kinase family protein, partial [Lachnospiraceae bacterium]|nr:CotH kinase family protein [Lachnospiraceae bacterium]
DKLKFMDAFLEEAARGRDVSIQDSRPCVVFLNGEYWGVYNIRERYNEEYLASHYDLDAAGIMLIKAGNAITMPEETMTAYQYMLSVVTECDLAYDDTYALADELIDLQSVIDYCCINLYLDNRDVAFGYNTALWRTVQEGTPYSDGKWRFMLYDLDECAFSDSNDLENIGHQMAEHPLLNEPAIRSLLDNEGFRRQFCLSFMDIANTVFSYERTHTMLAAWSSLYEAQIIKDHQRFYDDTYGVREFYEEVSRVDAFFANRFDFAMEELAETFGLTGVLTCIRINVDMPEGGTITVNTAQLEDCSAWEGYYYSDFPVSVSAHPKEGWHFAGWREDASGTAESLTISLENGDVSLRAVFEKD